MMKTRILSLLVVISMMLPTMTAFAQTQIQPEVEQLPIRLMSEAELPSPTSNEEEEAEKLLKDITEIAQTLELGEKDEDYTGDIDFHITFGSLPTLYSLLSLYTNIETAKAEGNEPSKAFVWYQRGGTANPESLPENATMMAEVSTAQTYNKEYAVRFMAYAQKLYKLYPNAHFNLYCDDLRIQYELLLFTYNHIPESNYNVYLLSDGTGSYSYIKNYLYADSESGSVEDVPGLVDDKLGLYKYWYEEYKRRVSKGVVSESKLFDGNAMQLCYVMYPACTLDNVEYWLQWPELMISDVPEYNEYFDTKLNRVKKLPNDIYAGLCEESKTEFMNAVLSATGLTKEDYDKTYFSDYNDGQKYMIISGTSPNGEKGGFDETVKNIIAHFGDEYIYMYKPHPSWAASKVDGREAFLAENNIIELPAQTPMETILWAYPNVNIGGYSSSLYMSSTGGQVKFFIANNPNDLGAPLPEIYKLGFYEGSVFINPTLIDESKAKMSYEDGIVNIEGCFASTLVAAKYGENGILEKVQIYNVPDSIKGAQTQSISSDFENSQEDVNIKLMLLSDMNSITPKTLSLDEVVGKLMTEPAA